MWDPFAEFQTETLPNGLTVHAAHWPGRPWEALGFLVHSGAVHEPVGLEGLAHFVEHLVSENTEGMTKTEQLQYFDDLGGDVSLGGTSFHRTGFDCFIPIEKSVLEKTLTFFGSMLITSQLRQKIESERQVIMSEFWGRVGSLENWGWLKKERSLMYSGLWRERYLSPMGDWQSISRITERDLQNFYDAHYTPANISVVGVGGLTLSQLTAYLQASPFGEEKPGKRTTLPEPITEFPAMTENRSIRPSARFWNFKIPKHATGSYNSAVRLPGNIPSPRVSVLAELLATELLSEIRGKNSWGYAPGCGLTGFLQFQELDFGCSALPHHVIGQVERVIESLVGSLHEKRALFESAKRQSVAKTRLLDVTAQKIRNGALHDLSHYGRIHSLKEDVETLESWSFEEFRQIQRLLVPSERRTIIRVPYAIPQTVKEKASEAWEWLRDK